MPSSPGSTRSSSMLDNGLLWAAGAVVVAGAAGWALDRTTAGSRAARKRGKASRSELLVPMTFEMTLVDAENNPTQTRVKGFSLIGLPGWAVTEEKMPWSPPDPSQKELPTATLVHLKIGQVLGQTSSALGGKGSDPVEAMFGTALLFENQYPGIGQLDREELIANQAKVESAIDQVQRSMDQKNDVFFTRTFKLWAKHQTDPAAFPTGWSPISETEWAVPGSPSVPRRRGDLRTLKVVYAVDTDSWDVLYTFPVAYRHELTAAEQQARRQGQKVIRQRRIDPWTEVPIVTGMASYPEAVGAALLAARMIDRWISAFGEDPDLLGSWVGTLRAYVAKEDPRVFRAQYAAAFGRNGQPLPGPSFEQIEDDLDRLEAKIVAAQKAHPQSRVGQQFVRRQAELQERQIAEQRKKRAEDQARARVVEQLADTARRRGLRPEDVREFEFASAATYPNPRRVRIERRAGDVWQIPRGPVVSEGHPPTEADVWRVLYGRKRPTAAEQIVWHTPLGVIFAEKLEDGWYVVRDAEIGALVAEHRPTERDFARLLHGLPAERGLQQRKRGGPRYRQGHVVSPVKLVAKKQDTRTFLTPWGDLSRIVRFPGDRWTFVRKDGAKGPLIKVGSAPTPAEFQAFLRRA